MSELRTVVLIWALLLTMAIAAGIGARHRGGPAALASASLVWLLVDGDFEGTVLIDVTAHNGLTTSDLVGVFGIVLAAAQWVWLTRRRRRG